MDWSDFCWFFLNISFGIKSSSHCNPNQVDQSRVQHLYCCGGPWKQGTWWENMSRTIHTWMLWVWKSKLLVDQKNMFLAASSCMHSLRVSSKGVIVNPHLGRFQQNDSAEVGHPHNGLLVSLSNSVCKRGVSSGGKKHETKNTCFLAKWNNYGHFSGDCGAAHFGDLMF